MTTETALWRLGFNDPMHPEREALDKVANEIEFHERCAQEAGARHHWYEAEIKIRDQRIQELEEQVASLQRVIQHRRDSDSVVDV